MSDEFYAPTPPLEANRLLFSEAATNRRVGRHEKKLFFIYVRKAYMLLGPLMWRSHPRCRDRAIAAGSVDACTGQKARRRGGKKLTRNR